MVISNLTKYHFHHEMGTFTLMNTTITVAEGDITVNKHDGLKDSEGYLFECDSPTTKT